MTVMHLAWAMNALRLWGSRSAASACVAGAVDEATLALCGV